MGLDYDSGTGSYFQNLMRAIVGNAPVENKIVEQPQLSMTSKVFKTAVSVVTVSGAAIFASGAVYGAGCLAKVTGDWLKLPQTCDYSLQEDGLIDQVGLKEAVREILKTSCESIQQNRPEWLPIAGEHLSTLGNIVEYCGKEAFQYSCLPFYAAFVKAPVWIEANAAKLCETATQYVPTAVKMNMSSLYAEIEKRWDSLVGA